MLFVDCRAGTWHEPGVGACGTVNAWMQAVKSDGRVTVPTRVLELARRDFLAERVADEQVRRLLFL